MSLRHSTPLWPCGVWVAQATTNRRLYAMKEAQRLIRERGPTVLVQARVKLYTWMPVFDVFLDHCDHRSNLGRFGPPWAALGRLGPLWAAPGALGAPGALAAPGASLRGRKWPFSIETLIKPGRFPPPPAWSPP